MTTAKGPYDAGTAFLKVVPSFRDFHPLLDKELKARSQRMGKQAGDAFAEGFKDAARKDLSGSLNDAVAEASDKGKDASKRAGKESGDAFAGAFRNALSSAGKDAVSGLGRQVGGELDRIRREIEHTKGLKIGVDISAAEAVAKVKALRAELDAVAGDRALDIEVRVNAAKAAGSLAGFARMVDAIDKKPVIEPQVKLSERQFGQFEAGLKRRLAAARAAIGDVQIGADSSPVDRELVRIRGEIDRVEASIGVDLDAAEARRQILALALQLAFLSDSAGDIKVKVDALEASTQLAAIDKLRERVDGREARIQADVDGAERAAVQLETLDQEARRTGNTSGLAANSFRAFSGVILGLALLGPLVIPVLAAMAAGIIGVGVASVSAVAGLGTLALGFSGVVMAVKALGDAEQAATRDRLSTARTMRAANNAIRDASRGVADARRGEVDAERSYTQALREQQRAQQDVVRARAEAQQQLEDLAIRVRGGALAERQAVLDLAEATHEWNMVSVDPFATSVDRERANINLRRQELNLESVTLANKRLGDESRKVAETGVDGTEVVVRAQERLVAANERVEAAQRGISDAVEQTRRAQERLVDAQISYQEALQQTSEVGSAAMQKLQQAMDGLSPAGRRFALFLHSLRDEARELRAVAQEGLLPGVQAGLEHLIERQGPRLTSFVGAMSTLFGRLFVEMARTFDTEPWQRFFDSFAHFTPIFTEQFFTIFSNAALGLANLWRGFAPFTESLGDALVSLSEKFAAWTAEIVETPEFQEFLDWMRANLPTVGKAILSLVLALANLAVALAPYAGDLLGAFTAILNFIAGMNPDVLGAIVLGLIGMTLAWQAMTSIMSIAGIVTQFVTALMAGAFSAVAAAVVGSIILIAVGLYLLYQRSQTFRNIVGAVWKAIRIAATATVNWFREEALPFLTVFFSIIGDHAQWVWSRVLRPVFKAIGDGFMLTMAILAWAWTNVGKPAWDVIAAVANWVWQTVLKPVFLAIGLAIEVLAAIFLWFWRHAAGPILELFGAVLLGLWRDVVSPVLGLIGDAFSLLGEGIGWVWKTLIEPPIRAFGDLLERWLLPLFNTVVDGIGRAWELLVDKLRGPIRFVVETVINKGLVDPFNVLARAFGTSEIPHLKLPADFDGSIPRTGGGGGGRTQQTFATGGPVGGFSPSKTADNIPAWLTAREFVHPVDSVDYYGLDVMELMRRRAIPREFFSMLGYAQGGLVEFGRELQRRGFRVGEHPAFGGVTPGGHGRTSLHHSGNAIDVNYGPAGTSAIEQSAIDAVVPLAAQYGLRTIWRVADHFNHAHFDTGSGGSLLGRVGEALGSVGRALLDPIGFLRDTAESLLGRVEKNTFGEMLVGGARRVLEWAIDKVRSLVDATGEFLFGSSGDGLSGGVMDAVRDVAAGYGWDVGNEWNALTWLIDKESGGNPNARNPSSTAYGLFQFLDSTWGTVNAVRTSDPRGQAVAGLRYVAQRYGTPSAAAEFHRRMGWYGEGGSAGEDPVPVGLYDSGGVIPKGLSAILNLTGEDERVTVINPEQDTVLKELLRVGVGGGGTTINVDARGTGATASDIASTFNHEVTRVRRGGKYAGRRG